MTIGLRYHSSQKQSDDDNWIVRGRYADSSRFRVFCFHCAGGSAGQFRPWAVAAPREIEIVAIQLPGRERRMREAPIESFGELLDPLMRAFARHVEKPYALFGHSLGSLVAFEVARAVRAARLPQPKRLIVAAHPAPQLKRWYSAVDEYPAPQLKEVLRKYGGISEELLRDNSVMNDLLPTIRADFKLARQYAYTHEAKLSYPISALAGESDGACTALDVRAWGEQTHSSFQYQAFPGDHFFVRQHSTALLKLFEHTAREH